jgi:acetyltransferase-like isoleucine patch superfamily enzyme
MIKMISKALRIVMNAIRFAGMPCWSRILAVEPSTRIDVHKRGKLAIGSGFRTRRNVELNVRENGKLTIGNNVFLNTGCVLTARNDISVGDGTIIGTYVQIFDNDHERIDNIVQDNSYKTAPVTIGRNCWRGAGSILLKGTELGDNCIVGAGSVVKGRYESGTTIIQKR